MCKASAPEEGDPFSQFLSLQADCASSNDEEVSWDSWAGQTGAKRQRTESIQRTESVDTCATNDTMPWDEGAGAWEAGVLLETDGLWNVLEKTDVSGSEDDIPAGSLFPESRGKTPAMPRISGLMENAGIDGTLGLGELSGVSASQRSPFLFHPWSWNGTGWCQPSHAELQGDYKGSDGTSSLSADEEAEPPFSLIGCDDESLDEGFGSELGFLLSGGDQVLGVHAGGMHEMGGTATAVRLRACPSCHDAKTACDDERPCNRCDRLGLRCEAEAHTRKRPACTSCKRSKVMCDLGDTGSCSRCMRMGSVCVPHEVVERKQPQFAKQPRARRRTGSSRVKQPHAAAHLQIAEAVATTMATVAATQ
eukprot:6592168-Prymnesium_polylepis.1